MTGKSADLRKYASVNRLRDSFRKLSLLEGLVKEWSLSIGGLHFFDAWERSENGLANSWQIPANGMARMPSFIKSYLKTTHMDPDYGYTIHHSPPQVRLDWFSSAYCRTIAQCTCSAVQTGRRRRKFDVDIFIPHILAGRFSSTGSFTSLTRTCQA